MTERIARLRLPGAPASSTCVVLSALALFACSSDAGRETLDSTAGPAPSGVYDWWIAGGTVIDGTGAPGRAADVLVRDGRIAYVGPLDEEAADAIDATHRFDAAGLVVTPGFIDAHAHADPVEQPTLDNFLAMGVTTIVLGQDGGSPRAEDMAAHLDAVDAAHPGVNVAYLLGHATIRREAGVEYGQPDREGLVRMAGLVTAGLREGAFGLSTGLEYNPGSLAEMPELVRVAEPVAAVDGVVASHLRSENAGEVEGALDELLTQGRESGARVHVSHIKIVLEDDTAAATALLARMAAARDSGMDVTADIYPYTASYTGLSILFPDWALPPADYDSVVASRRDDLAAHLRQRVESRNGPGATRFGNGEYAGRTLAEVAAGESRPYEDVLIDLGPDGASAAYFVMDEDVMKRLLVDRHVAISSDGSPTMLHPRGHGAFARVIRRYVVGDSLLTIEEAVRKMSGFTASIFRLDDPAVVEVPRGRVRTGWAADLLAFDPAEVEDQATFEQPHLLAAGMRGVWVDGEAALLDGEPVAGDGRGRALRARR
ncbi:MAG: amidohydrolase family protein [Gemmatimonadales bacterium]|jgi:N-acyl-D-aspartate/D-glutamate deacylase